MELSAIYKRSVIYPVFISLVFVTIYIVIDACTYKSEWLTGEAFIGPTIVISLLYGLVICILSLTIFLNTLKEVSSNLFLSALSWFLLPGGFICSVLGMAVYEYRTFGPDSDLIYPIILNLPYILGLAWGFWKFKTKGR